MKIRNKSECKNFFDVLVSWCLISFVKQAGCNVVVGNFAHLPVCIAFFFSILFSYYMYIPYVLYSLCTSGGMEEGHSVELNNGVCIPGEKY
jgi:hypothetical protein